LPLHDLSSCTEYFSTQGLCQEGNSHASLPFNNRLCSSTHRSASSPFVIHRILRRRSCINKSATNLHCCVSESKSESEMSSSSPSFPLYPIDSNPNSSLSSSSEHDSSLRTPCRFAVSCWIMRAVHGYRTSCMKRDAALRRWNARTWTQRNETCQGRCRDRAGARGR
jgi:hypothetical protein